MQLLLFWIIQLHCSPRSKSAKWFATMDQISRFQWLTVEKTQHAVKAAETLTSNLGLQPHTAKTCLLSDPEAELKQGQDTCILSSSSTPPQTKDSLALHITSSYLKEAFFLFWLLEVKNTAVHFNSCFFFQSQAGWGNPLTMMPLCLYAVRTDLRDVGTWQIHEAGNFEIKFMVGIIYRFTNTSVHLQSQGYLPHFPRVQEHPPPPVVEKTNKKLNLSCYVCTELASAVKK